MVGKSAIAAAFAIGAMACCAVPGLADVKTGVDAWSRGDYDAAIKEWQAPAAKGDADALFNLGQAYKLGRGVKQDLGKAEEFYAKAAKLGHLQAQDNYGLMLFHRGARKEALPYLQASADRGDSRAMYLLGIAHFNGDLVEKDWVRAYALVTLANQAGLPQAASALSQMDAHIPLEQRQASVSMATQIADQIAANRSRAMASAELASQTPAPSVPIAAPVKLQPKPLPTPPPVKVAATPPLANPPVVAPKPLPNPTPTAVTAIPARIPSESPATAGADFARPHTVAARPKTPVSVAAPAQRPSPAPAVTAPKPAATPTAKPAAATAASTATGGSWHLQLGAFGVVSNAAAMQDRLKSRPELAGHGLRMVPSGKVTTLIASGFTSQASAHQACSKLGAAGFSCLVAHN